VSITHIFFGLHGILIDSSVLAPCYSRRKCEILAERYGGGLELWQAAERTLLAEWDDYHADLNFSGDNGMDDFYEALFRTTRALFRLAKVTEPPKDELTALARELPGEAPRRCQALYPEVKTALEQARADGYLQGIMTHVLESQARAILEGCGVLPLFRAPIVGVNTFERFDKDEMYFRQAARQAVTHPAACLVVDTHPFSLTAARRAGMHTVLIQRGESQIDVNAADTVLRDLSGLAEFLRVRG
jgi:beta-phosphoglucomutase-like phosphatase (HAD superfamily)